MMNANMNPNTLLLLGMHKKQIDKVFSHFGVSPPNYSINASDYFPTKIYPRMSEEAIKEQAKKDALSDAGYFGSKESQALRREYEAVADPDRRKIINSSLQAASRTSLTSNNKLEFANFKDSSGRQVASYSKYSGWMAIGTQEEHERSMKFLTIYRETYWGLCDQGNSGNRLLNKCV